MTKASDNVYPSVLFGEQASTPATPATGDWRLYFKSDGLYYVDDAGSASGPLPTSSGGISSGTANPGSPTSGDLFFRTDLHMLITYDGTRWLSPQHSMGPGYSAGIPLTANGDARFPVDTTYGIWMDYLATTTFAGGLSGSAYWTVALKWATAAGTETSLGSFTNSADTSANWTPHKITLGSVLDSTARGMRVTLDKTGAPGNLYIGIQLLYRFIIT